MAIYLDVLKGLAQEAEIRAWPKLNPDKNGRVSTVRTIRMYDKVIKEYKWTWVIDIQDPNLELQFKLTFL